jgi:hypothetical protein
VPEVTCHVLYQQQVQRHIDFDMDKTLKGMSKTFALELK